MFTEQEVSQLLNLPYQHQTTLPAWEKINQLDLHPYEKISLFDLQHYLPDNLLYKMDIASMAFGLEVRVPYLDHNLVEFALQVPWEYKIGEGQQKWLMKKVLERYLPSDLIYRKKWGFPAPVGQWMLAELAPLVNEYLSSEKVRQQGIFEPTAVQKLVNEFRAGRQYHFKRVWALLTFSMWYEQYVEQNAPEEPSRLSGLQ